MGLKLTQPGTPSASAMLRQCLETADVLQGRTLEVLQHVPTELHGRVQEIHRSSSAIARQLHAAIDDCHEPSAVDANGEPCLTIALDLCDEIESQIRRAQQAYSTVGNDGDAAYLNQVLDRLESLRSDIAEVQK